MNKHFKVIGVGVAVIDLIAVVKAFPQPDAKIRSQNLERHGGGNALNALCCLSRLDCQTWIVTKLGLDAIGNELTDICNREHVSTDLIRYKENFDSAFSYIIVDSQTHTRTIIYTPPKEDLFPEETIQRLLQTKGTELDSNNRELILEHLLKDVDLLYQDSRHVEVGIEFTNVFKRIHPDRPVLMDCEKIREPPFLDLLALCTHLVTNSEFPFIFWKEQIHHDGKEENVDLLIAMEALLNHQPQYQLVITTQGASGSILMDKEPTNSPAITTLADIQQHVLNSTSNLNSTEYHKPTQASEFSFTSKRTGKTYRILACPAIRLEKVADTTGAGDCFIGSICYGLIKQLPRKTMMEFATYMAGMKCTKLGSISGIPRYEEVKSLFPV